MTSSVSSDTPGAFAGHGSFLAATLAAAQPHAAPLRATGDAQLAWLDVGVLRYLPAQADGAGLLLSAGVHGDETAPIEALDALAAALVDGSLQPRRALLLLLGNPAAIVAGRRYVDANMNRLFLPGEAPAGATGERRRARLLMRHAADFLGTQAGAAHLDLHTAIRGSRYRRFAISPGDAGQTPWPARLGAWGIEALVYNPRTRSTFAAWSALHCGARSFTVELGRARPFGRNYPQDLAPFRAGLRAFLRDGDGDPGAAGAAAPRAFAVSREIIKAREDFRLHLDPDCENFTPCAAGTLLASEGSRRYHARDQEHILFPNAAVAAGERALLLLRPDEPGGHRAGS